MKVIAWTKTLANVSSGSRSFGVNIPYCGARTRISSLVSMGAIAPSRNAHKGGTIGVAEQKRAPYLAAQQPAEKDALDALTEGIVLHRTRANVLLAGQVTTVGSQYVKSVLTGN